MKVDKRLRPTDSDVYAIIYWFERLKDGVCKAGNETMADILGVDERTVGFALQRLKKYGYIKINYTDGTMRNRINIETLVSFSKHEQARAEDVEEKKETPGQIARKFFEDESSQVFIVEELSKKIGVQKEILQKEISKFVLYWTELNKSGTKMKWEMQQTFDVRRRLVTWLGNGKVTQKKTQGCVI